MAMGRPKIEIDKSAFEALCFCGCKLADIVEYFNERDTPVSISTIKRWVKREYGYTFERLSAKMKLRRNMKLVQNQLRLSEKSASMAIWLGKQWLGQRDNMDITMEMNKGDIADELEKHYRQRNADTDSGLPAE